MPRSRVRKLRGTGIGDFKRRIAGLGVKAAQEIARDAAPELSRMALADFNAGNTAYGDARPEGTHGPVTLIRTGATQRDLGFRATGTTIWARLKQRYSKYLIGKYRILPIGNAPMPAKWKRALDSIVARVLQSRAAA